MRPPNRALLLWGTSVGAFAAADWYADRHGWPTLSRCIRWAFRTDTPLGCVAFAATLVTGGAVLYRHITGG